MHLAGATAMLDALRYGGMNPDPSTQNCGGATCGEVAGSSPGSVDTHVREGSDGYRGLRLLSYDVEQKGGMVCFQEATTPG